MKILIKVVVNWNTEEFYLQPNCNVKLLWTKSIKSMRNFAKNTIWHQRMTNVSVRTFMPFD